MLLPDRKYFAVDFFVNHRRVISALYLRNKKLPQRGAFCQSSQVLEDRQDFVACFALRSPPTRGSWYIRKPVIAFHRYLRPFGQSTAQWRMTDLLHDPRSQPKPKNTNSRGALGRGRTSNLDDRSVLLCPLSYEGKDKKCTRCAGEFFIFFSSYKSLLKHCIKYHRLAQQHHHRP